MKRGWKSLGIWRLGHSFYRKERQLLDGVQLLTLRPPTWKWQIQIISENQNIWLKTKVIFVHFKGVTNVSPNGISGLGFSESTMKQLPWLFKVKTCGCQGRLQFRPFSVQLGKYLRIKSRFCVCLELYAVNCYLILLPDQNLPNWITFSLMVYPFWTTR